MKKAGGMVWVAIAAVPLTQIVMAVTLLLQKECKSTALNNVHMTLYHYYILLIEDCMLSTQV